jgi:hypothetical protein
MGALDNVKENAKEFLGIGGGLATPNTQLRADIMISLTPKGHDKVTSEMNNSKSMKILQFLVDEGASSLRDICQETHIDIDTVKEKANLMLGKGYVRVTAAGGSSE